MKVLVVHDNGSLGRALLERLRQTRLEVTPVLVSDPGRLDLGAVGQWIPADTDLVVDALWQSDPEAAEQAPEQIRQLAFSLPLAMAEHARDHGMAMIQLSSAYVFDGRKQSAYITSNPGNPIGQLGIWQWEAEQALRTLLPRHVILRTGWGLARFITKVQDHATTDGRLSLSSKHLGQPVTTQDLARVMVAIVQQLDCGAEVWGTYQYAGAEEVTHYELGLALAKLPAIRDSVRVVDAVPEWAKVEPENATMGCTKIRNTFGIKQMPWRAELEDELALLALNGTPRRHLQSVEVK